VAEHIFQSRPVWICTHQNIANIIKWQIKLSPESCDMSYVPLINNMPFLFALIWYFSISNASYLMILLVKESIKTQPNSPKDS
jgi:hypothetical protein